MQKKKLHLSKKCNNKNRRKYLDQWILRCVLAICCCTDETRLTAIDRHARLFCWWICGDGGWLGALTEVRDGRRDYIKANNVHSYIEETKKQYDFTNGCCILCGARQRSINATRFFECFFLFLQSATSGIASFMFSSARNCFVYVKNIIF